MLRLDNSGRGPKATSHPDGPVNKQESEKSEGCRACQTSRAAGATPRRQAPHSELPRRGSLAARCIPWSFDQASFRTFKSGEVRSGSSRGRRWRDQKRARSSAMGANQSLKKASRGHRSFPNPRVRYRVQHIRQKIHCDVGQSNRQDAALDQVVVAV